MEVTSEDPNFPIESALGSNDGQGWRASQGGEQQIRIIFDTLVSVHRMELRSMKRVTSARKSLLFDGRVNQLGRR